MNDFNNRLLDAILKAPKWAGPDTRSTPEALYMSRRQWLQKAGFSGAALTLAGCGLSIDGNPLGTTGTDTGTPDPIYGDCQTNAFPPPHDAYYPASVNTGFEVTDRDHTPAELATQYNNYYEFTVFKDKVCTLTSEFPTYPWNLEVGGLVENPQTFSLDDLVENFTLEERLYRFRCVEAWSMVVPWTGFQLSKLLATVRPTPEAKFVRFISANDPATMPGVNLIPQYPWPYTEGLRLDEAQNELTLLAMGLYQKPLLTQNGAPIRLVVPSKYGYKNPKSLVKIELTAEQPATFWNSIGPTEYSFESNVDPDEPHPRWSQAEERPLGGTGTIPTLRYNGYEDYVGSLYA